MVRKSRNISKRIVNFFLFILMIVLIFFLLTNPTIWNLIIFIPLMILLLLEIFPNKGKYPKSLLESSEFFLMVSRLAIIPLVMAFFVYYALVAITQNVSIIKYVVLANIIIFEAIAFLPFFKKFSKITLKRIRTLTPFIDIYIITLAFFYSSTIRAVNPLKAFQNLNLEAYPGVLILLLGVFLLGKYMYMNIYKKKKLKIYLDILTWIIYIIIVYFILRIVV